MVSAAIAKGMKLLAEKTGVAAEKVIAELALIGFANMGEDGAGLSCPGSSVVAGPELEGDEKPL